MTDDLDVDPQDQISTSNITTTVHGTGKPVQCLTIKNLIVTPLSGDASISIETAITHDLPDVLDDVPSPEEVITIPGLSHLADSFPPKESWPTIILIGRDCIPAQSHTRTVLSEDNCQLAVQTPLGWATIGKPAQSTRPLSYEQAYDTCLLYTSPSPRD